MSSAVSVLRQRGAGPQEEATAWLGMLLFLGSWTMLFGSLFAIYAALRIRDPQWLPDGLPRLPLLLPLANTLAILAVSASIESALRAARQARTSAILPAAVAALVIGIGFLAGQTALWFQVYRSGLRVGLAAIASLFYTLTVFHALHVAAGLVGLAWVVARARRRLYGPARHIGLRLWAAYWHFVGVLWLLIFAALFVF